MADCFVATFKLSNQPFIYGVCKFYDNKCSDPEVRTNAFGVLLMQVRVQYSPSKVKDVCTNKLYNAMKIGLTSPCPGYCMISCLLADECQFNSEVPFKLGNEVECSNGEIMVKTCKKNSNSNCVFLCEPETI